MERKIFNGKTVEDAVEKGLLELQLTREDVEIEVISRGEKKLFRSVPAEVAITVKEKKTDGERAIAFLAGLLKKLDVAAEPVLVNEEEKIIIELKTEETKSLIGRHGEMIDAVQALAGAVANIGRNDYKRVVVDCGGYREEREEKLKRVAEKLAAKAVRLGKKVRLEAMNPYDRRTVHAALAENSEVTTKSEGKEPARYVVIIPKNLKARPEKRGDRRFHDRGERGERNDRGGRDRSGDRGGKKFDKYGKKRDRAFESHRELPKEGTPVSSGTSLSKSGGSGYQKGNYSRFIGTYLGNSRDDEAAGDAIEPATPESDSAPNEE